MSSRSSQSWLPATTSSGRPRPAERRSSTAFADATSPEFARSPDDHHRVDPLAPERRPRLIEALRQGREVERPVPLSASVRVRRPVDVADDAEPHSGASVPTARPKSLRWVHVAKRGGPAVASARVLPCPERAQRAAAGGRFSRAAGGGAARRRAASPGAALLALQRTAGNRAGPASRERCGDCARARPRHVRQPDRGGARGPGEGRARHPAVRGDARPSRSRTADREEMARALSAPRPSASRPLAGRDGADRPSQHPVKTAEHMGPKAVIPDKLSEERYLLERFPRMFPDLVRFLASTDGKLPTVNVQTLYGVPVRGPAATRPTTSSTTSRPAAARPRCRGAWT